MNNWFLIYCKPGQDTRAEVNLSRQGYHVFRPTINVVKNKIGCRNAVRCEPLFPRYVFIKVDPKVTSIAPVSNTFGVSNFVKFGDRYAMASDRLINEIRKLADEQQNTTDQMGKFKRGDQIYVDGHGFDHVEAIYETPCGDERAMILLRILGRESKIVVPKRCISRK